MTMTNFYHKLVLSVSLFFVLYIENNVSADTFGNASIARSSWGEDPIFGYSPRVWISDTSIPNYQAPWGFVTAFRVFIDAQAAVNSDLYLQLWTRLQYGTYSLKWQTIVSAGSYVAGSILQVLVNSTSEGTPLELGPNDRLGFAWSGSFFPLDADKNGASPYQQIFYKSFYTININGNLSPPKVGVTSYFTSFPIAVTFSMEVVIEKYPAKNQIYLGNELRVRNGQYIPRSGCSTIDSGIKLSNGNINAFFLRLAPQPQLISTTSTTILLNVTFQIWSPCINSVNKLVLIYEKTIGISQSGLKNSYLALYLSPEEKVFVNETSLVGFYFPDNNCDQQAQHNSATYSSSNVYYSDNSAISNRIINVCSANVEFQLDTSYSIQLAAYSYDLSFAVLMTRTAPIFTGYHIFSSLNSISSTSTILSNTNTKSSTLTPYNGLIDSKIFNALILTTPSSITVNGMVVAYERTQLNILGPNEVYYGNELKQRYVWGLNPHIPAEQRMWVDDTINGPKPQWGFLKSFWLYIDSNATILPDLYVQIYGYNDTIVGMYQLKWQQKLTGYKPGKLYEVVGGLPTNGYSLEINTNDRVGFTCVGSFCPITLDLEQDAPNNPTSAHRTYFYPSRLNNNQLPSLGAFYTFDNNALRSIFSIGMTINTVPSMASKQIYSGNNLQIQSSLFTPKKLYTFVDAGLILTTGKITSFYFRFAPLKSSISIYLYVWLPLDDGQFKLVYQQYATVQPNNNAPYSLITLTNGPQVTPSHLVGFYLPYNGILYYDEIQTAQVYQMPVTNGLPVLNNTYNIDTLGYFYKFSYGVAISQE